MKIFDMNCLGTRNDEKRGKGKKELIPKMTVNKSVKRITFNTCAFETMELMVGVRFELEDDGTWYVAQDTSERGITLSAHRGVFYFLSATLIRSILPDSRQYSASFVLVREGHRWRLDEAANHFRKRKPSSSSKKTRQKKLNHAQRVVQQYRQSDFPGRIKTYQTIASERLLSSSH